MCSFSGNFCKSYKIWLKWILEVYRTTILSNTQFSWVASSKIASSKFLPRLLFSLIESLYHSNTVLQWKYSPWNHAVLREIVQLLTNKLSITLLPWAQHSEKPLDFWVVEEPKGNFGRSFCLVHELGLSHDLIKNLQMRVYLGHLALA